MWVINVDRRLSLSLFESERFVRLTARVTQQFRELPPDRAGFRTGRFRLDTFGKLATVKLADGARTLLNWLADEPAIEGIETELATVAHAGRVGLDRWRADPRVETK